MSYQDFTPGYYSQLIRQQQQNVLLDNLYFYVAGGSNQSATANTQLKTVYDEQQLLTEVIYGGKIAPNNLIAMVRKVDWVSGQRYAEYNSRDPELGSKNFYCINSIGNVYKCINNSEGGASTQEPQTTIPGNFTLSDGYTWCYMYKLTSNQLADYSIGGYIPLIVDPAVVSAAVRGTVSSIEVRVPGEYSELNTGQIQQVISNTVVRIADNANSLSGTYNGMGMYILSGAGQGEYYRINTYTANSMGRFVNLSSNLLSAGLGSRYDIAPYIRIDGNGSGATARAVMAGRTISRVQILNSGSDYTIANASVVSNNAYTISNSLVDVNLSPSRGHGADPYQELYVSNLLINIELDNYTINNDLPVDEITFDRVGLLRHLADDVDQSEYTASTYNNTFTAQVPVAFGEFEVGDIVVNPINNVRAKLVYANSSHVIGVYQSPYARYAQGNTLQSSNGDTQATIISITQPEVNLEPTDIVSITNVDTTKRDENSREILQLLVKVK
jgi:hypothetical protein